MANTKDTLPTLPGQQTSSGAIQPTSTPKHIGYDPKLLTSSATGTSGRPISALPPDSKILELIAAENGVLPARKAATTAFWGINQLSSGLPVPLNNDSYGLAFFTRPRLNLSYNNILRDRPMTVLLSQDPKNMFRAIRAILDPVGQRGRSTAVQNKFNRKHVTGQGATASDAPGQGKPLREGFGDHTAFPSDLIDPASAFIAIATNSLTNMSGWLDPVVDTYTSDEGRYREQWSMADGFANIYQVTDINTTFRNMTKSPLMWLFYYWCRYMLLVREGKLNPYPEMVIEHEIDYQTRIYRVVLDQTRQYVTAIACTGASYPTSNSLGSFFNYSIDKPHNPDMDEISITWRSMGICYADPIVVDEFNAVVIMFNPSMADGARQTTMTKVPMAARVYFNYKAYPRIDPDTAEMQWYVTNTAWQSWVSTMNNL